MHAAPSSAARRRAAASGGPQDSTLNQKHDGCSGAPTPATEFLREIDARRHAQDITPGHRRSAWQAPPSPALQCSRARGGIGRVSAAASRATPIIVIMAAPVTVAMMPAIAAVTLRHVGTRVVRPGGVEDDRRAGTPSATTSAGRPRPRARTTNAFVARIAPRCQDRSCTGGTRRDGCGPRSTAAAAAPFRQAAEPGPASIPASIGDRHVTRTV